MELVLLVGRFLNMTRIKRENYLTLGDYWILARLYFLRAWAVRHKGTKSLELHNAGRPGALVGFTDAAGGDCTV